MDVVLFQLFNIENCRISDSEFHITPAIERSPVVYQI